MKTSNKDALNKAIKGFVSRLEKTEKFVLDQAPDICKQMVKEVEIQSKMEMGLGVALLLFAAISVPVSIHNDLIRYACTYNDGVPGCSEPTWFMASLVMGAVAACFSASLLYNSAYKLAYLKNCPKLFLLKEFRKLVK